MGDDPSLPGACHDPTHVRFFTERTFDYFTADKTTYSSAYNYYSEARFRILAVIPGQRRILGLLPARIQWLLAHHLSTLHSIEFRLKVAKTEGSSLHATGQVGSAHVSLS